MLYVSIFYFPEGPGILKTCLQLRDTIIHFQGIISDELYFIRQLQKYCLLPLRD